ncbi:MAG: AAA family ATPase [Planctomycetota bacterium]
MKLKQIRVDGYKNLINCVVNLGDFNVLVGPNNSGKSNLLEALQILWPMCFGDEKLRIGILNGLTPRFTGDSSICHLPHHRNKPMTVGVAFEVAVDQKLWVVDYEVKVRFYDSEKKNGTFVWEKLTAKEPSKPGPARKYIWREDKHMEIVGKEHRIARGNSSLLAISSLYPDYEGLNLELKRFVEAINWLGMTNIFAISPAALRSGIDEEKPIGDIRVSSFDLSFVLDGIKQEGKYYTLFKDSLCDILGLEAINFEVQIKQHPSKDKGSKETSKRLRYFLLKRHGDDYSLIEEYSDGTLVVAAILEALFSEKARGPILCLEELENCLHPAAVEKLLGFLQDHAGKWPVLITTHSPYVLNCVNPEDVNVAIMDETGATHFEKVRNTKQLRDYLKSGFMSFGDMLASNFKDVLGK